MYNYRDENNKDLSIGGIFTVPDLEKKDDDQKKKEERRPKKKNSKKKM